MRGGGAAGAGAGREGSSGASPLDVVLRAPRTLANLWHTCLKRSMTLLEDLDAARAMPLPPATHPQLLPLRRETVELELNKLFEGAFEACAGSAIDAIASLDPLMEACVVKMQTAATTLPPRRDLFAAYADGIHHRLCNIYQVILVRYDLDRSYLDTEGQHAKAVSGHKEVLEPALMLSLIGWAKRCARLLRIASDCFGLLWTASDCFGLLRIASDCFGLLQIASYRSPTAPARRLHAECLLMILLDCNYHHQEPYSAGKARLQAELAGLTAGSTHSFHFHKWGDMTVDLNDGRLGALRRPSAPFGVLPSPSESFRVL